MDLVMNLEIRAALNDLKQAIDAGRLVKKTLRNLMVSLRSYQKRLGFVDAYLGPLYRGLNNQVAKLRDPDIDIILKQFEDWKNPAVRHGIVPGFFNALENYCQK